MGIREGSNSKRTGVSYIVDNKHDWNVDSDTSLRGHIIKQRMISKFDKMTRRKTDGNK